MTPYTTAKCLREHPTYERTKKLSKGRIRRTCLVGQAREIEKQTLIEKLPQSIERILPLNFVPAWRKDATNIEIRTSASGTEHKDTGIENDGRTSTDMGSDISRQISRR